jgi:hypothetical protein
VGHGVVLLAYVPTLLCDACCASAGGPDAAALVGAGPERALSAAPVDALLEALPQVRAGVPADTRVLLTVAGPATLHAQLCERAGAATSTELAAYVAGVFVALANAACAAGADGLALIERFDAGTPSRIDRSRRTLRKLTDFHGVALVAFVTGGEAPEDGFDQVFDLVGGEGPIVVARPGHGALPWACTREDVPGSSDVEHVRALADTTSGAESR